MMTIRPFRLKIWMLLVLVFVVAVAIAAPRKIDDWKNRQDACREALKYADWRDRYTILIKAHRGPEPPPKLITFRRMCETFADMYQYTADGNTEYRVFAIPGAEPPDPSYFETGTRPNP